MMAFVGKIHNAEQSLGTKLGGDIGDVLQGLAAKKAQQVKVNQNRQLLGSLGLGKEQASNLAHYDDKTIFDFLKTIPGLYVGDQNQGYSQGSQQGMEGLAPQQEQQQGQYQDPAQNRFQQGYNQGQPNQQSNMQQGQVPGMGQQNGVQGSERPRLMTKGNTNKPNPFELAEFKENLKERHESVKESRKFAKSLLSDYKVAKENNMRLDKMEKLIETGRLTPSLFASGINAISKGVFGKHTGIDLSSLLTTETQEFNKLSADFVKGAKNVFGSRITDKDLEVFMNTIPHAGQSNQAKQALIDNLRVFNQGIEARQLAAKGILKANNGVVPPNFEQLVEDVSESRLDELAKEFNQIRHKDVAPALGHAFKPGQYQQLKSEKEEKIRKHQEAKKK
jgi:hypothetical protein